MSRIAFNILLALLGTISQLPPSTQGDSASAKIEGIIVDSRSQRPVSTAEVALVLRRFQGDTSGPVRLLTASNAEGRFEFQNLRAGFYFISVTADGYAPQAYGVSKLGKSEGNGKLVQVSAGAEISNISVALAPTGVVSGRVAVDGQPVSGVEVRLIYPTHDPFDGHISYKSEAVAFSDDRGDYRIQSVTPSKYYIMAGAQTAQGSQRSVAVVTKRYPVTLYPGTRNIERAASIEIAPGEGKSGMDIAITSLPTYGVRGEVRDAKTSQALSGAVTVEVFRREEIFGPTAAVRRSIVGPKGDFEIQDLIPGKYWLLSRSTAAANDRLQRAPTAVAFEIVSSSIEGLLVRMAPEITLRGVVRVENPQRPDVNLKGIVVVARPTIFAGSVPLVPRPPSPSLVQENGAFQIQRLAPSAYGVGVSSLPQGFFIKAITQDRRDVLKDGLQIMEESSSTLEIVLGDNGGRVEGLVRDSAKLPVVNAWTVLVPVGLTSPHLYSSARTDSKGHFEITNVAPGNYRVFAWEYVEEGAYYDSDFMQPLLEMGAPIQVGESSVIQVDLNAIP